MGRALFARDVCRPKKKWQVSFITVPMNSRGAMMTNVESSQTPILRKWTRFYGTMYMLYMSYVQHQFLNEIRQLSTQFL
jgi:hypothetical protein